MKLVRLLAFAPFTLTGACAVLSPQYHDPDGTLVGTQVGAEEVAACIAQSTGVSAVPVGQSRFAVDVPGQPQPTRLMIFRDKVQTVVVGPTDERAPDSVKKIALDCVLKLTPPTKQA